MCSTVAGGDLMQLFRVRTPEGRDVGYLRVLRDDLHFKGAKSPQAGLRLWLWRRGEPPTYEEAFETDATDEVLEALQNGHLDWYDENLRVGMLVSTKAIAEVLRTTGWQS